MVDKVVLDASVIAKWFVEEELSEKALKIRDLCVEGKLEIFIPELAFLEVLSALSKRMKKNLNEVAKALSLFSFNVVYLDEELLNEIVKIEEKTKLTVYDAVYLAISKKLKCKLITCDVKLSKFCIHLKDFKL